MSNVIFTKKYSAESIVDVERDINEAIEKIPVDEHGFARGEFTVVITREENSPT